MWRLRSSIRQCVGPPGYYLRPPCCPLHGELKALHCTQSHTGETDGLAWQQYVQDRQNVNTLQSGVQPRQTAICQVLVRTPTSAVCRLTNRSPTYSLMMYVNYANLKRVWQQTAVLHLNYLRSFFWLVQQSVCNPKSAKAARSKTTVCVNLNSSYSLKGLHAPHYYINTPLTRNPLDKENHSKTQKERAWNPAEGSLLPGVFRSLRFH